MVYGTVLRAVLPVPKKKRLRLIVLTSPYRSNYGILRNGG